MEKVKYETKVDVNSFRLTITFKEPININNGDKLFIDYEDLVPVLVAIRRKK